jgi:hypothetical protein
MDSFMSFLRPGIAPKGVDKAVPEAVLQAVGSGTWSVIQHELVRDQSKSLPELAPALVRILLTPLAAS